MATEGKEGRRKPEGIKHLDRHIVEMQGQIRRLEGRLDDLTRAQALHGLELPPPHDLTANRFRVYSQNGEDGLVLEILRRAGIGPGRFVDIGCGLKGGNSRFAAEELGWSGLMLDGRPEIATLQELFAPGRVRSIPTWVTRENIDDLLRASGLQGEIDLLSIDLDGMDYWIWEAITEVAPRLVVCEYNSYLGADAAVTVPYRADFVRKDGDTRYYGASLAALVSLARRRGLRLIAVEPAGVNAFFLRDDLAPDLPGFAARDVFRRQARHAAAIAKGQFVMDELTPENGLPLVDVETTGYWRPSASTSA